jgi:hypothetical protein
VTLWRRKAHFHMPSAEAPVPFGGGSPPDPDPMPDWFYTHSPLTMDALRGPDDQYRAGALDMLTVLRAHPEWLEAS